MKTDAFAATAQKLFSFLWKQAKLLVSIDKKMAEETFREFVTIKYTELDSRKHSRNKDIADLMVDNNAVNTSLTGTINNYGCRSLRKYQ